MCPGAWMGRSQRCCGSGAPGTAPLLPADAGLRAMAVSSEHREGICRRARAAYHVERRDHQHELVALLLDADPRQRLELRVVEERHAVGEEAGGARPPGVVAE